MNLTLSKTFHFNGAQDQLTEIRTLFLKKFMGHKVKSTQTQCPLACMFWEGIYSYYPDNSSSALRFLGFSREFLKFLIGNRRFSEEYANWIETNHDTLLKQFSNLRKPKITFYDLKMYADMLLSGIKEALIYV